MQTGEVKILLVDDHQMMREGLRLLLKNQQGLTVVGEAANGQAALELARLHAPDLVVMDIHLPGEDGIAVSRRILAEFPQIRIIVLSSDPDLALVHQALQAGISGYITKENSPEELTRAIQAAMDHRSYLCPEVASVVLEDYMKTLVAKPGPAKPQLTERERQLLKLVAGGKRNKEIAEELGTGVKSVETYRSRLMKKLGCGSTADLTRYAIREGIVSA